jgi:hypothetical protein
MLARVADDGTHDAALDAGHRREGSGRRRGGRVNRFHHRYYPSRHGDQRHAVQGRGVDQGACIGQATRSTCGTQWDYARCVGQMPPLTSRNLRPELGKEMIKSLTRDRAWGACPAPGHTGAG